MAEDFANLSRAEPQVDCGVMAASVRRCAEVRVTELVCPLSSLIVITPHVKGFISSPGELKLESFGSCGERLCFSKRRLP
jgi:hypothetical protein